jgi:nitrite reductase (NAD(P)H)
MNYAEREGVKGGRAAVIGGGLLGLEAAKAVHDLCVFRCAYPAQCSFPPCTRSPAIPQVTIVNRQKFPLSRQIDSDAGEMVLHAIQAMGVQVLTSVSVQDIITKLSGEEVFTALDLTDGTHVEAAPVIFAIGTTP